MITRSELRKQQAAEQPENKQPAKRPLKSVWLGTVLIVLLVVGMLLKATILNPSFVANEIVASPITSELQSQINGQLSQNGLVNLKISDEDTKELVKQATKQVYAGEDINLDLDKLENKWQTQLNQQLSSYGLSTTMLPSGSLDQLQNQLNQTINQQLNTAPIQTAVKTIKTAKVIVNAVLVVSLLGLVILGIKNLIQKTLLAYFSWATTIASGVVILLIKGAEVMVKQITQNDSQDAATIVTISQDVFAKSWQFVVGIIIVAVVCWILRIIGKFSSGLIKSWN